MGFTTNVNYSQTTGSNSNNGQVILFEARDPTSSDTRYPIGKQWFNTTNSNLWILQDYTSASGILSAVWQQFGTSMEAITQYAVLVGGSDSTIASITPDASTTKVLVSGGVSANPSWQAVSASGAVTTITGNSGGAESPSSGNFNVLGTGSITVVGTANTETIQVTGLTNHAVLVGAGTSTITKVGPTATAGQIFQSAGSSADPVFSTATYPATATGTGTILRADGTNWVATTATYPATTTLNQLLYSSSANVVGGVTAAIDGVLISSHATGIPSWLANGTANYVLTAQSGAPPIWAPALSQFTVTVQSFTSNGTYTPTAGMKYCRVECVGGGGGGGGAAGSGAAAATGTAGSGGAGGQYSVGFFSAATIGASQAVTVGAAGTAGSNVGGNGGNGGITSLGALISADSGLGGTGSIILTANIIPGGQSQGTGTGGYLNSIGSPGSPSIVILNAVSIAAIGGTGGSTYFGGTQTSVAINMAGTGVGSATAGNQGSARGSGGGGGVSVSGTGGAGGGATGGIGIAGVVIVTEFI